MHILVFLQGVSPGSASYVPRDASTHNQQSCGEEPLPSPWHFLQHLERSSCRQAVRRSRLLRYFSQRTRTGTHEARLSARDAKDLGLAPLRPRLFRASRRPSPPPTRFVDIAAPNPIFYPASCPSRGACAVVCPSERSSFPTFSQILPLPRLGVRSWRSREPGRWRRPRPRHLLLQSCGARQSLLERWEKAERGGKIPDHSCRIWRGRQGARLWWHKEFRCNVRRICDYVAAIDIGY
mmetsp:Transcript_23181/g.52957  ORF Transcript_23181/g.52957 Transcript_23181/m.52957 type:complete len:237 (-) Transcript_23181:98-808(-)